MHFGVTDIQLYFYFLVFAVAVLFSWFIPGWLVVSKTKIEHIGLKFLLAFPVGLALWGVQAYIFGYAQLRWMSFVYIVICAVLFYRAMVHTRFKEFVLLKSFILKQPFWLWLIIAMSVFIQVLGHIGSGFRTDTGVAFYFVNSVDGMMHLGYIQSMIGQFPPVEPGAVHLPLVNYHYWSDLVLADLARVWRLPVAHLFFQYAPLLLAFLTTTLFISLIKLLGGGVKTIIVGIFLITFGSDAAYLITQVLHGSWGQNVSSLDSGVSFYFNIPQVFARTIFVAVMILLVTWHRTRHMLTGVVLMILIATLFGFKVYYALYAVTGLACVIVFQLISALRNQLKSSSWRAGIVTVLRSQWPSFALFLLLAVISLSIYLPTNRAAGGLRYSFFEWPHLLLSADNIKYEDWFLRMQVYEAAGNTRNIVIYNLFAVFLTGVAVYGTRMIGLIPFFKLKTDAWRVMAVFLIPANILFVLLGLFTLQTSGGLNIYNFLIVPIVAFNLFAAFNVSMLSKKFFIPLFIVFVLVTLPRGVMQLSSYLDRYRSQKADFIVQTAELEALTFIKNSTDPTAVVQLVPMSDQERLTPYIAYFSERRSYIAGIEMLKSHNQPTADRLATLTSALAIELPSSKISELQRMGITHLVVPTDKLETLGLGLEVPVFQNSSTTVLRISG